MFGATALLGTLRAAHIQCMQTSSLDAIVPTCTAAVDMRDPPGAVARYDGRLERKRGLKEAAKQIPLLRTTWPASFSSDPTQVRPLASSALRAIIEAFGWTPPYARAVLSVWKSRSPYCHAVLRHAERFHLDGTTSTETVDDKAREGAGARLAQLAARTRTKGRRTAPAKGGA